MIADLQVLSGTLAGETITITTEVVAGRGAGLGMRFDPERDLDVSEHHATIVFTGGRWIVRDLDSRNGTFVNGRRVREADLAAGDRIRFGAAGPEVEFRPHGTARAAAPAVHLEQSNRRLRLTVGLLTLTLFGAIGYGVWSVTRQRSDWDRERTALLSRVDSALAAGEETVRALTGEREGLAEVLDETQAEVRLLRSQLQGASEADTVATADLRRRLQSAMAALDRQQLAASIDFDRIDALTRRAVAVVWVEGPDGTVSTGTGFAVRPDGTIVTSRHVLTGETGDRMPRRIGVQFTDSRQVFPAVLVGTATDADIAIIRTSNLIGDVPVVAGLNLGMDTIQAGAPIAWIGFPLGGETWPQDAATGRLARPLGAVGVLTAVNERNIAVQGYGAAGASGSPILDGNGEVIAVLTGGTTSGRTRELFGVPAAAVDALLRRVAPPGVSPM